MKGWSDAARKWAPPDGWRRILTVDAHTAGEPLRVVLEGFGELKGESILARRRDAQLRLDALRTALLWEPRGHADMYGCLLTPPVTAGADVGVLFLHNEGYSTMCGHGVIALVTVILEMGILPAREGENRVGLDTPAGFVEAWGTVSRGRVEEVSFVNVPSFAQALDREVTVPGFGTLRYDLAYGGAFYAFVEAASLGLALVPQEVRRIVEAAHAVKEAVAAVDPPRHPLDPELGFVYGVIFVGPPHDPAHHSRHVCVFADGEVDRSPTGTGVSARLALHQARGELAPGQEIVVESILGTTFGGCVVGTTKLGPHDAVIPRVRGKAHLTGRSEFWIAPDDPLQGGFLLR